MSSNKINLSWNERLVLSNQYRILEILNPGMADDYRMMRTIVENGYSLHYGELGEESIKPEDMHHDACEEVMDILDMYRAISDSAKRLSLSESNYQFPGFDGNNESEQFGYARFLVFEQQRWQDVLDGRPSFDLNSHSRSIDGYRRMLIHWKEMGSPYELELNQINDLFSARRGIR